MAAKDCSRCWYNILIAIVTLEVVLALIIHVFAWHELDSLDWFVKLRGVAWDDITCLMEVRWVFWIWLIIFLLQLLWLLYGMSLTWRKTKDGFLFEDAGTMPASFYLLFFLGVGGNIAWYFVWGRLGYVQWAAIAISLSALLLLFAHAVSLWALMAGKVGLRAISRTNDIWLTQIFVHNGVAGYATWLSVMTMYNVGLLIKMGHLLREHPSCSVTFSLIMAFIFVWFVVDMITFKRRVSLVFLPYIIVMVAFASALVRNINIDRANSSPFKDELNIILPGIFMGLTGLFLIVKLTVVCCTRRLDDKDVEVRSLHDENVYVMQ